MLNKSEIIGGTISIIAVFALLTGIYNIVIYQNVSNSLATGNLVNIADTTTATKTADTSTSTTTAAVTSTGTATAAITLTPVFTDVITTNPPEECRRTLPFGYSAGDEVDPPSEVQTSFNSCLLLNVTLEQPHIYFLEYFASLVIGKNTTSIKIYAISSDNWGDDWSSFYRRVESEKEKEAISCLVNNWDTVEAYVYTWNKINTQENEEEQVIQIIIASLGQSATYIIRIYSDSLPTTDMEEPVLITYDHPVSRVTFKFLGNLGVDDVRGKRQIFDVTYPVKENENLTVVKEGENCRIFC